MSFLVTGFLGAGKSTLISNLRTRGLDAVEGSALTSPPAGHRVIAVADSANLATCLDDPLVGPLVRAQIQSAGLVCVSRGDIVDAAAAVDAVTSLTDAPVVEAPNGALDPGLLDDLAESRPQEIIDLTDSFHEWIYDGAATLRLKAVEGMLSRRPIGLYRLKGRLQTDKGAMLVEVAGKVRQTDRLEGKGPTQLTAVGLRPAFRPEEMSLWLAEGAAQSGFLAGIFGHR